MIAEIVLGVIFIVWGIVILTGKVDKWLIYSGKQMNEKRLRLVRGLCCLLGGVWFILEGCFGFDTNIIFLVPLAILCIVTAILEYTWCRKMPETQTA